MVICKGCNNPTEVLIPSPIGLQNGDGTGEIITELCESCLVNVLKAMKEEGIGRQSKYSEKIDDIHSLINKAIELDIKIPTGTQVSVEHLKKLIAERE